MGRETFSPVAIVKSERGGGDRPRWLFSTKEARYDDDGGDDVADSALSERGFL